MHTGGHIQMHEQPYGLFVLFLFVIIENPDRFDDAL